MQPARTSPYVRLLPSMTDIAFLMPLVFLFCEMKGAQTLLGDGDTGWHLRTGEWILAHGRVPRNDIFSFTRPDQPWFAWEWLWDVLFGWLHREAGMAAVVLGCSLVLGANLCAVVPAGTPPERCAGGAGIHAGGRGGLGGTLAGASAPVYHAVHGGVCFRAGARQRGPRVPPFMAASAANGAVDQSAWRVLCGHHT